MINNNDKMFYKDVHDISASLKKIVSLLDRISRVKKDTVSCTDDVAQLRRALGLPDNDDDLK